MNKESEASFKVCGQLSSALCVDKIWKANRDKILSITKYVRRIKGLPHLISLVWIEVRIWSPVK